jgi:hypothetical protein
VWHLLLAALPLSWVPGESTGFKRFISSEVNSSPSEYFFPSHVLHHSSSFPQSFKLSINPVSIQIPTVVYNALSVIAASDHDSPRESGSITVNTHTAMMLPRFLKRVIIEGFAKKSRRGRQQQHLLNSFSLLLGRLSFQRGSSEVIFDILLDRRIKQEVFST